MRLSVTLWIIISSNELSFGWKAVSFPGVRCWVWFSRRYLKLGHTYTHVCTSKKKISNVHWVQRAKATKSVDYNAIGSSLLLQRPNFIKGLKFNYLVLSNMT